MATTKFYLDMRGKAKDGKGSVVIILAHNQTTHRSQPAYVFIHINGAVHLQ